MAPIITIVDHWQKSLLIYENHPEVRVLLFALTKIWSSYSWCLNYLGLFRGLKKINLNFSTHSHCGHHWVRLLIYMPREWGHFYLIWLKFDPRIMNTWIIWRCFKHFKKLILFSVTHIASMVIIGQGQSYMGNGSQVVTPIVLSPIGLHILDAWIKGSCSNEFKK